MTKSSRRKSYWSTVDGFSAAILLGTFGVVALFVYCWRAYDPSVRRSFGLRTEYVAQILSSYAPLVGATLLGFRDVLFGSVSIGASKKRRSIPITGGVGVLYATALVGIGAAAAALIFVSTDPPEAQAQWLIGGVATLWAATLGAIFHRFFRIHAVAGDADPDA